MRALTNTLSFLNLVAEWALHGLLRAAISIALLATLLSGAFGL